MFLDALLGQLIQKCPGSVNQAAKAALNEGARCDFFSAVEMYNILPKTTE
jgi:hypothetical protein